VPYRASGPPSRSSITSESGSSGTPKQAPSTTRTSPPWPTATGCDPGRRLPHLRRPERTNRPHVPSRGRPIRNRAAHHAPCCGSSVAERITSSPPVVLPQDHHHSPLRRRPPRWTPIRPDPDLRCRRCPPRDLRDPSRPRHPHW